MTYLGDIKANSTLTPLQAASCTYRIDVAQVGHPPFFDEVAFSG